MTGIRRRRWLTSTILCTVALLALRDAIAVAMIERLGSRLLENRLTIGQFHSGLRQITIESICLADPAGELPPLVTVDRIEILPSLLRGLRDGVWASTVTVQRPQLTLSLDAQGRLLNRLPASDPDAPPVDFDLKIPLEQLLVDDARLTLLQDGRQPLSLTGGSLRLQTSKQANVLVARIADLLGATVELTTRVDPLSFAGQSQLKLTTLDGNWERWSQLPLLPQPTRQLLTDRLTELGLADLHGSIDARVQIEHPAEPHRNLTQHHASITATLRNVHAATSGPLIDTARLRLTHSPQQTDVMIDAQTLSGKVQFGATTHLGGLLRQWQQSPAMPLLDRLQTLHQPLTCDWRTEASDCDLQPLVNLFRDRLPADWLAAGVHLHWSGHGRASLAGRNRLMDQAGQTGSGHPANQRTPGEPDGSAAVVAVFDASWDCRATEPFVLLTMTDAPPAPADSQPSGLAAAPASAGTLRIAGPQSSSLALTAQGQFPLADPRQISGTATAEAGITPYDLRQLDGWFRQRQASHAATTDKPAATAIEPSLHGTVHWHAALTTPLQWDRIAAEGRAASQLTINDLSGWQLKSDDVRLGLTFQNGQIEATTGDLSLHSQQHNDLVLRARGSLQTELHSVQTELPSGRAELRSGRAAAPTVQPLAASPLQASLDVDLPSLQALAAAIGQSSLGLAGDLSASVRLQNRLNTVAQMTAWLGDFSLRLHQPMILGETLDDAQLHGRLQDGWFSLQPLDYRWRETRFQLAASGDWSGLIRDRQATLNGRFTADPLQLHDIATLAARFSSRPLPLRGRAQINGQFSLATAASPASPSPASPTATDPPAPAPAPASPLTATASGQVQLLDASFDGTAIQQADLQWRFADRRLQLSSHSDQFFGGSYRANFELDQLDWQQASLVGQMDNVQLRQLAQLSPTPLPPGASINGSISGTARLVGIADPTTLSGQLTLRSDGVTLNHLPVEIADGRLIIRSGDVQALLRGRASDGPISFQGATQLGPLLLALQQSPQRWETLPVDAELAIDRVSLERLTQLLQLDRRQFPVQGHASVRVVRGPAQRRDGQLVDATVSLEDLRWQRMQLSPRLTAHLDVTPTLVRLRSVEGQIADGRVQASGEVRLAAVPDGQLDLSVHRVSLRRAAAPFLGPSLPVGGTADLAVRARLGRTLSGNVRLAANHVTAAGVAIPRVRLPLDWSYGLASKTARWRSRGGVVDAGNGQVRIATDGSFNRLLDLNLTAELARIDTSRLLVGNSPSAGVLDGKVTLSAKRARSLKQFSGTFDVDLSQVKVMAMPVIADLQQLTALPSLTTLARDPARDGGFVTGRFANGVVTIDQLALRQHNVQVLMEGTSTLDGRLSLQLVASTGDQSPTEGLTSLIDSPLMLAAPAPVALLAKANEMMKNRVVHVHVAGTAQRPILQLQPGKTLTQDAIRFFLVGNLGAPLAHAATSNNANKRR